MFQKKIFILAMSLLTPLISYAQTSISTCADLQVINNKLNENYILENDIDCSGYAFRPIGSLGTPFTGTLDGASHKIIGLSIQQKESDYVGLFGMTQNATIQQLTLEKVNILGKNYVGALAGATQKTTLIDVSSSGNVSGYTAGNLMAGSAEMGGLVGFLSDNSSINRGSSSANVTAIFDPNNIYAEYDMVGGLVGESKYSSITQSHASGHVFATSAVGGLVGTSNTPITNSYATGAVDTFAFIYAGQSSDVGGLVGSLGASVSQCYASGNVGNQSKGYLPISAGGLIGAAALANDGNVYTIENNFATGEVNGTEEGSQASGVGGLIGTQIGKVKLINNYSTGKVVDHQTSANYAGGLVGFVDKSSLHDVNNYWNIETSEQQTSMAGAGKTTNQMYQQATYVNWNFNTIWHITEGQSYPCLVGLNCPSAK